MSEPQRHSSWGPAEPKTVTEPAHDVPVVREVDVVVAGGGPAGVAAAIAAARRGARTILVERYGYLGGMATGGMVIVLDDMDDFEARRTVVGGIVQEMIDRLDALGGAVYPPPEDRHVVDQAVWDRWARWGWAGVHVGRLEPKPVPFGVTVDPDLMKYVCQELCIEAGVELRLHSFVANPLVEENRVTGVVTDGKSGRQAILGKIIIDCTGDGDVFARAGADYRTGKLFVTLVHRIANVDTARASRFEREHPEEWRALEQEARHIVQTGYNYFWLYSVRPNTIWVNAPTFPGLDTTNVDDLTMVEIEARRKIIAWLDFARKRIPGFEEAYLIDTAPQVGVRQSRLLDGIYTMTRHDVEQRTLFEDTIGHGPTFSIPYRALVPKRVDGLLVAGRCYSAEPLAQRKSREIPTCMVMGQAAGTAAALAIQSGVQPRDVDIALLQRRLLEDGAIISPGGFR